eukprot:TRINITY_DN8860_c1_g1_i1.p3 TRINITY_DN8860_c1_g1~~TRINITY_DN8860_c1_g1_i1.p3  ORF type:complete len:131 (+),score=0.89 TRINITY_DN8860_c1_g1_i1:766-1158(+)
MMLIQRQLRYENLVYLFANCAVFKNLQECFYVIFTDRGQCVNLATNDSNFYDVGMHAFTIFYRQIQVNQPVFIIMYFWVHLKPDFCACFRVFSIFLCKGVNKLYTLEIIKKSNVFGDFEEGVEIFRFNAA